MKKYDFDKKPVRCAILMSGSGSNAEALLEFERTQQSPPYRVTVIATDAPETSRAKELAENLYCVQFASVPDFLVRMHAAKFIPHTDMSLFPSVRIK